MNETSDGPSVLPAEREFGASGYSPYSIRGNNLPGYTIKGVLVKSLACKSIKLSFLPCRFLI